MNRNKRQFRFGLIWLLLLCSYSSIFAQSQGPTGSTDHRVLFVGNSYTYYNSMPQMFKAISEYRLPGHTVEAKFIGGGGATLEKHWEVEIAREEIRSGKWDYVVLQEQSMLGATDLTDPDSPQQFYKYARMFDREIKMSGAETVFYMTWSRKNQHDVQPFLTRAYLTVANELGSSVAPVGMVWDVVRDNPDIELYVEDGSHPSIAGSFLAALTLSETIFGISPDDIPGVLYGREILRGGALAQSESQLSDLPDDQVQVIEAAVADVAALMEN